MDHETSSRLFEPFFTTKAVGHGTGLGLAMVFGIVNQSGGHIAVKTRLGYGTQFDIFMPLAPSTSVLTPAEPILSDEVLGGSERILVVEDDDGVRELTSDVLSRLGYKVLALSDTRLIPEQLREAQFEPDLVITDVVMPHFNGRQVADQVTGQYPECVVLFISGYTEDMIADHGVMKPDIAFLAKPFASPDLAQAVRRLLDSVVPAGRA